METATRGLIHELDAGRYRAVIREGVPVIEREDTAGAVWQVLVPISLDLLEGLTATWSEPVQFKIEDGRLTFRRIT
jgi:hypothetical protein